MATPCSMRASALILPRPVFTGQVPESGTLTVIAAAGSMIHHPRNVINC